MNESYRAFYEEKALNYPDRDLTSVARYEKAIDLAGIHEGDTLLDIACKDAVMLELLEQRHLRAQYTGVDISSRVIEKNQALNKRGNFLVADVVKGTDLPAKSFDRIFALEILEHVPQPTALLEEARRLLRDDGRLLLSVPNPYYYMEFINELRRFPETDGHLFAFREANIRALFDLCGFEVEDSVGTYLTIPKRLRGAFRSQHVWILKNIPRLLACSRVYRCRKKPLA